MSYVRIVGADEALPEPPATYALSTGYEPDRFQKFAIAAIEAGENVLVTAKTGSGKTFVGEYQIAKSLARGGRVFYTTPIKSLSNQKFHDLKKLFPEASVGIMTGDIKFRPDAQIIVMTTEILRNLLFKQGTATAHIGVTALMSLDDLDAVVFDEVHYINDPDRGHVWEETLMLLPPTVKLILLSATLSHPEDFAGWLGNSKQRRVWLISTLWRAVPLEHCVIGNGPHGLAPLVIYDAKEQFAEQVYKGWLQGRSDLLLAADKFKEKVRSVKAGGHEGAVQGKARPKAFEHQMNELLEWLDTHAALPAIFFVFSRAGCERLAGLVSASFIDSSDAATVAHIWDFHLSRYRTALEKSGQYHELRTLAMRGIAYHHSGLLPFLKEILEILFNKGLIKVLFATETFAVGINMPTKTVVFTALEKFTDGSMRPLKSSEYVQMAGRAGRRGKDTKGLVIYLPQREPVDLYTLRQMLCGKAATFGSRMTFHYDFVLKVLGQAPAQAQDQTQAADGPAPGHQLIEKSYWYALQRKELESIRREIALSEKLAEDKRVLLGDALAVCEKREELEARIATTQNAKKKAAQRELEAFVREEPKGFADIRKRYLEYKESSATCARLTRLLYEVDCETSVPSVLQRLRILEEYGYVSGRQLTLRGKMASEINEGHLVLTTELYARVRECSKSWCLADFLTVLAIFLGDAHQDSDRTIPLAQLRVSPQIHKEFDAVFMDAKIGCQREERVGLRGDPDFWSLSTEWVEPIQSWVTTDDILPVVAAQAGQGEGTFQKMLLKLMGLVEEVRGLATLCGDVEWLEILEPAQQILLRDTVVAESLYLRL